jgi:hypothetical protein
MRTARQPKAPRDNNTFRLGSAPPKYYELDEEPDGGMGSVNKMIDILAGYENASVTWSVSDITSESGSILSNLSKTTGNSKLERIEEGEDEESQPGEEECDDTGMDMFQNTLNPLPPEDFLYHVDSPALKLHPDLHYAGMDHVSVGSTTGHPNFLENPYVVESKNPYVVEPALTSKERCHVAGMTEDEDSSAHKGRLRYYLYYVGVDQGSVESMMEQHPNFLEEEGHYVVEPALTSKERCEVTGMTDNEDSSAHKHCLDQYYLDCVGVDQGSVESTAEHPNFSEEEDHYVVETALASKERCEVAGMPDVEPRETTVPSYSPEEESTQIEGCRFLDDKDGANSIAESDTETVGDSKGNQHSAVSFASDSENLRGADDNESLSSADDHNHSISYSVSEDSQPNDDNSDDDDDITVRTMDIDYSMLLASSALRLHDSNGTIDGAADDEHSLSTTSSAYTQETSNISGHNLEVTIANNTRPSDGLPVVETVVSEEETSETEG